MNVALTEREPVIMAVSVDEVQKFGCPHCGYRSGSMPMTVGGSAVWRCGECNKTSSVLGCGIKMSTIAFGSYYPKLQEHPRKGTPAHGTPDERPENDSGEYFNSRGTGIDWSPGCFVCGGENGLLSNISGFVRCKASGERIVHMFTSGARLDYREFEPDYVQVKIGACNRHKDQLKTLHQTVHTGIITPQIVALSLLES